MSRLDRHVAAVQNKLALGRFATALGTLLTFSLMPTMDLFGRQQARDKQAVQTQEIEKAKKEVQRALAVVNATPKGVADEEAIKQAQNDLMKMMNQPIRDPEH